MASFDKRKKPKRKKTAKKNMAAKRRGAANRKKVSTKSSVLSRKRNQQMWTFLIVGIVAFMAAAIILAFVITRTHGKVGVKNTSLEASNMVNMSDPGNEEYSRMYASPIDDAHVSEEEDSRFIDNEVLISVKDGMSRDEVVRLAEQYGAEIVGEIEVTGDYQLRLDGKFSMKELNALIEQLNSVESIESAILNYVSEISGMAQKKESYGFCYGKKWQKDLQNADDIQGKSWGMEAIDAIGAWEKLTNASRTIQPVRVGVVDCGFDANHEDLDFAQIFYDNGANGLTSGSIAHGTHVAGIMASKNNDTTGICGIYPYGEGNLYGIANCSGQGVTQYNNSLMSEKIAFAELIVRNVKVINSSRGFNWESDSTFSNWYTHTATDPHFSDFDACADFLGDFFQKMLDKGYDFVIVSAAGNDSRGLPNPFDAEYSFWLNHISRTKYPNVFDRIIVVGAVDYHLDIAPYSNGGNRVDIYAPGGESARGNQEIYSTLANSKYGYMHGTSMAAPHVAGVAAMVWSANPSMRGAQVKQAITGNLSSRCTSCNMVDAKQAVSYALRQPENTVTPDAQNGAVLCYVVERDNEAFRIEDANVTMCNVSTNQVYTATTDEFGHFELLVPAGNYTLTVTAENFTDFEWPDGNNYQNSIVVRNNEVLYLKSWIKMTRVAGTLNVSQNSGGNAGSVSNGFLSNDENEFFSLLEDEFEDYDYGVPLEDVIAWKIYNGHLYALYDYAVSAHVMSLITMIDPSVHLVTITDAAEQAAVEELIACGGRAVYYTGNMVDGEGKVSTINGESVEYSNWYPGCPESYKAEDCQDIVVLYRGLESPAEEDPDFGAWFEVLEDEYSFLDFFDADLEGVTRGIVIEWDTTDANS